MAGAFIAPVGLMSMVANSGYSGLDLGRVLASHNLALLVFLAPARYFVDRHLQVTVLIAAHLLSAVSYALTAIWVSTNAVTVAALAAFATTTGVSAAFIEIARRHLVASLAAGHIRQQVNSLLGATENLLAIVGPIVAGCIAATAGPGWVLASAAPCHLIAALHLIPIRALGKHQGASRPPRPSSGWKEIRSRTWVWVTIMTSAVLNGIHGAVWTVLAPLGAPLHVEGADWGIILGAYAAGVLAMNTLLYHVTVRRLLLFGQVFLALAGPVPFAAFMADLDVIHLAIAAFTSGLGFGGFVVAWETSLQADIPPGALTRILAYDRGSSLAAVLLGQLAVVPIAVGIGSAATLLVSAILFSAFGFLPLFSADFRNRHAMNPQVGGVALTRSDRKPSQADSTRLGF